MRTTGELEHERSRFFAKKGCFMHVVCWCLSRAVLGLAESFHCKSNCWRMCGCGWIRLRSRDGVAKSKARCDNELDLIDVFAESGGSAEERVGDLVMCGADGEVFVFLCDWIGLLAGYSRYLQTAITRLAFQQASLFLSWLICTADVVLVLVIALRREIGLR